MPFVFHKAIYSTKCIIIIVTFLLCSLACTEIITPHLVPNFGSFDVDAEEWGIKFNGPKSGIYYNSQGGNIGGFIYTNDDSIGTRYYVAPVTFIDQVRYSYGRQLYFELKQIGPKGNYVDDDVVLISNSTTLKLRSKFVPDTIWTSFSVKLDELAGWKRGSSCITKEEFQRVLIDLNQIWIRGEYLIGPDCVGLDNVQIR